MKTYLKLCSIALLTITGVSHSQGAQTNLVQSLAFKLTAWSQGATTTNGSLVTVNANSQSIVTKDVLTWLGLATTNNFATSQLLVVNQLGTPESKAHVIVRTKLNGATNNVDVSNFFGTEIYVAAVNSLATVNSYSYNNSNNVVNPGKYYGYWGFYLLENPSYPALPVTFNVNGFGVDAVNNIIGKKKVVLGLADQFSTTNAVGFGHVQGRPFIVTGNVSITGTTLEAQP
jgi:hypothetical protein